MKDLLEGPNRNLTSNGFGDLSGLEKLFEGKGLEDLFKIID